VNRSRPLARNPTTKKVTLVLQGGGALGSYQAGVYEALSTSQYMPDWIAGISVGVINAAIIAGNAPEKRVERLRAFWEGITVPSSLWPALCCTITGDNRRASSLNALIFGQPGFFVRRWPMHWLVGATPTSYYDTRALKDTLERLVDFDRINAREIRFSVAAVNVRTGNFAYFDNAQITIRPEHVMASSALPPSFPAVEIDGEYDWDGGLVSNTPLQYVLESIPRCSRLTFQADLFHARRRQPADIEEVSEREKDIRYSSKTRAVTDLFHTIHDVRHNINSLWDQLPNRLRDTPEAKFLYNFGCVTTIDIVGSFTGRLILRVPRKTTSSAEPRCGDAGRKGCPTQTTLLASLWLAPMPPEVGARTFDVLKDLHPEGGPGPVEIRKTGFHARLRGGHAFS
jgi:NTE family protein